MCKSKAHKEPQGGADREEADSHAVKTNAITCCVASLLMFGCVSRPASNRATKTYTLPSWGNGAPRLQIDLPSSFSMRRREGQSASEVLRCPTMATCKSW